MEPIDWRLLHIARAELEHRLHLLREELFSPLDDFFSLLTHVFDVLVPLFNRRLEQVSQCLCLRLKLEARQDRLNTCLEHRVAASDLYSLGLCDVEFFYLFGKLIHALLDVPHCLLHGAFEPDEGVDSLNDFVLVSRQAVVQLVLQHLGEHHASI